MNVLMRMEYGGRDIVCASSGRVTAADLSAAMGWPPFAAWAAALEPGVVLGLVRVTSVNWTDNRIESIGIKTTILGPNEHAKPLEFVLPESEPSDPDPKLP